jgi:hypothetical protein
MKSRWFLFVYLPLYVVTWIGAIGYPSHFQKRVEEMHQQAIVQQQEQSRKFAEAGFEYEQIPIFESPGCDTDYSIAIAPGVLLANSSYWIAPLWGKGGTKIVLWYGWGYAEFTLCGWIS